MTFNLDRNLVFFDIESTGLNIIKDRIIQIALIKYTPNGDTPEELSLLVNPGIPISEEAYNVHGISNEDVRNKPTFEQIGKSIYDFIGQADLAGYNSDRFDIPMLIEEFHRIGIQFDISKRRLVDVQKIFYKMEPRTLKAAYKFYCDKDLEDAHDALADVRATVEVFKGQITAYDNKDYTDGDGNVLKTPIKNDIKQIAAFIKDSSAIDITQRLKVNAKEEIIFNFGKYSGRSVAEVFKTEPTYYHWMMEKDFSAQVKQIITQIKEQLNVK
ncbi:MAG TPA: 3'-5' exonuclease [Saprospiraceae bacterium]|mgnify:CR=1 FL=1|nr:3'-5' exonuclease [Saprospiraceae bacterium]HRO07869.1 3'-5' exonuclease [Saprospiraceae bacterium]HRO73761.1 3'-5' exonuclease [Saprospiraceae bacterium]HRP41267.1 3'-5' exonuclease [Saprospiraceae bacterium]